MTKPTRTKRSSHRHLKVGQPPGTLAYQGPRQGIPVHVTMLAYGPQSYQETPLKDLSRQARRADDQTVCWINVDGLQDTALIERIGHHWGIHPLVLEDILSTDQRPKVTDHPTYLYAVMKMLDYDESTRSIRSEQLSLILGQGFVITFQETPEDVFEPVRKRIRSGVGKIRQMGSDYLFYALLDILIDRIFVILEKQSEHFEDLEDRILTDPSDATLQEVHRIKRELIFLRRACWPLRELVGALDRGESPLIGTAVKPYLRDLYEHVIQVIDILEAQRDLSAGLLDLYVSNVSNRMNEVMKVLTMIATLFIPATFLAGIYGMNFDHMPELHWRYGYPLVWAVIAGLFLGLWWFFRRKKWF